MRKKLERLIVDFAVGQVFADLGLSTPVYCADVLSEADIRRLSASLPLIFIWKEDQAPGAFRLSVNEPMLVRLLAPLVPRGDPSFCRIHGEVALGIMHASRDVFAACREPGAKPSERFTSGENAPCVERELHRFIPTEPAQRSIGIAF